MEGSNQQAMHSSAVACEHQIVDRGRGLCRIFHATLTNGRQHNPCHEHIGLYMGHNLGDIGRGMHALAKQLRPTVGIINQVLQASDIVWVYLASEATQRHAKSSKVCTNKSWRVFIILETSTSTNGKNYQPTIVRFGQATLANDRQY